MSTSLVLPSLVVAVLVLAPIDSGTPALGPHAAQASDSEARRAHGLAAATHHGDRLARIASEDDALALYRTDLAPALGIEDTTPLLDPTETRRRRPESVPPPALKVPALNLVKELARWDAARALREAADGGQTSELAALVQREGQREPWLFSGEEARNLGRALRIAAVIVAVQDPLAATVQQSTSSRELATYLDDTYPDFASGPQSWVLLAEQEGAAGIRQRMLEHWKGDGRGDVSEAAMRWYFQTRLRPVFLAQVAASALLAEAEAQRHADELWRQLRSWREDWSTARGRARLCGTWAWTVHNHQNHQDHKMVVTFPPPDLTVTGPALPKSIVVLGDSVYLRWEFPGGYQEDSLLLSGKDKRLEGTFVNSRGPYGAITGRKVKRCSPE